MYRQLVRLALILALVSTACSLPIFARQGSQATPRAVSQRDPVTGALVTATPFQPLGPTGTPAPGIGDSTGESGITATPDPAGEITLPAPVKITETMPEEVTNLMILGSDYRPSSGYRTDIIILVSINKKKGTVSAVSFPRDLYVSIPGWETNRINTAMAHGGFTMLQDTMEYNFGVRPEFYIMTNFQGFIGIVDSLGGIDVNVGRYLSDTCDLPQAVDGYCTAYEGVNHMNGATALWYVRSRHTTSDFERGRKAQEVMLALFTKLVSLDAITRFPDLYQQYSSSVDTDMSLGDMVSLLPVAPQVLADGSRLRQFRVTSNEATGYTTDQGASVLLPDYDAIKAILHEAIFGPQ